MLQQAPLRGAFVRFALVLCLVVASACTSVTSRLAGWYVTRELDSYLDLSGEQKEWLRPRVDQTLEQLRRDHLPAWLNLLRTTRDALAQGVTDPQLLALHDRYDQLSERALDLLAPQLAALLAELSDEQIDHFERRARERLEEIYEGRDLPPEERRERQDEHLLEGLESLFGKLRDDQEQIVLQAAHALPDDRPAQYQLHLSRIVAAKVFLRTHPGASAIEAELRRLWHTRDEGLGRDRTTRRAEQRRLLLTIDRTLSPEQRARGVETLNDRIRSLRRFALPAS